MMATILGVAASSSAVSGRRLRLEPHCLVLIFEATLEDQSNGRLRLTGKSVSSRSVQVTLLDRRIFIDKDDSTNYSVVGHRLRGCDRHHSRGRVKAVMFVQGALIA